MSTAEVTAETDAAFARWKPRCSNVVPRYAATASNHGVGLATSAPSARDPSAAKRAPTCLESSDVTTKRIPAAKEAATPDPSPVRAVPTTRPTKRIPTWAHAPTDAVEG